MFKRRTFRRKFSGSRFAKKRLIWVTRSTNFTESAGTTSQVQLLLPADWEDNTTTGNSAHYCKVLRCLLIVTSGVLATFEARRYSVTKDDTAVGAGLNPDTVANYANTDTVHVGTLYIPGLTGNVAGSGGAVPVFNGYPDGVRIIRVNRRMSQQDQLVMNISPALAAANQENFFILSRVLVQLG